MTPTPAAAALLTHKVRDYDIWRQGFDGHESARRQAGLLSHHVNRGADDPNLVSIYMTAGSLGQLQAFGASADLKAVMERAGVLGEPTIVPMVPVENRTVAQPLAAAVVIHDVADFDAWKKAFDAGEPLRKQQGIVGHAISRRADRPNTVVVYAQARSVDELRRFAASPELKADMQRAGVVGVPQMMFVQGLDSKTYS